MTRFVIDEVVLQNAYTGKDSNGNIDRNATHFVLEFCDSSHYLALNTKIKTKYHKLSSKLGNQKIMLNVPSLIHQLLLNKKRVEYFEQSAFDFNGPKECDREFVRVSKESSAFLVTEDNQLITTIETNGLTPMIRVRRVRDARNLLRS